MFFFFSFFFWLDISAWHERQRALFWLYRYDDGQQGWGLLLYSVASASKHHSAHKIRLCSSDHVVCGMFIFAFACMWAYVRMYAWVHVCIYVCVCVWVHECMCVYLHVCERAFICVWEPSDHSAFPGMGRARVIGGFEPFLWALGAYSAFRLAPGIFSWILWI